MTNNVITSLGLGFAAIGLAGLIWFTVPASADDTYARYKQSGATTQKHELRKTCPPYCLKSRHHHPHHMLPLGDDFGVWGPYHRLYEDDIIYVYPAAKLSCLRVKSILSRRGYTSVRAVDCEGRRYVFSAKSGKKRHLLTVDARSGRILSRQRER